MTAQGIRALTINSQRYRVKGEVTVQFSGDKRETIEGMDGPQGHTVKPMRGRIEGTVTDPGDIDLDELFELSDARVIVELANGRTVIGQGMAYVGDREMTSSEGELQLQLEGAAVFSDY